ncbi:response regulator transcription factor [Asticcacaulis sp. 201]|uniref:response regulator transcription factor n=1 Tax=Asticcacaulis sp. 201 TaxID=3028787 RepID=UPI002916015C|nr:response regulator transcription factor [Asticcacaulis sp. 201]MDV6329968.1 response regulator transcription factor [Asticcacaulis sp. 201]
MTNQDLCLLVEDQPPNQIRMTEALKTAFENVRVEVTGSLKEARQWLAGASPGAFTLAVVDLGLPDGSGVDIIAEISTAFPQVITVVSSIYDDDGHLFEALSAGARGYLLKTQEPEMIVHYLRRIEQGEPPLSPSIALRLLSHFRTHLRPSSEVALTGRETETLALLARGLTIAEVARHLMLSPPTVAGYVKTIYQKLNISSRAEATLQAVKRGLA